MKPLFNRVLIKRDPLPEKKVGSIFLPDENTQTKFPSTGLVVSIGDVKNVNIGDRVIFGENSYQYFDKEKDLILVEEDDILAILDNGK